MATLNLGSFSNIKSESVIGYITKKGQFSVYGAGASLGTAGSNVASVSLTDSNWTLNISNDAVAKTAITAIQDTSTGKNWNITGTAAALAGLKSVKLGKGNDSVSITDGGINGKLTIDTGDGNDVINLASAIDAVTVTAGAGNDSVVIGKSTDSLKVDLGAGQDSLTVGTAGKALTITSSGSDAKLVTVSAVSKNTVVDITLGAGADSLTFKGETAVTGKINLGAGKDFLVSEAGFTNATVSSGAGDKTVSVTKAVTDSSISTGGGADSLSITGGLVNSTISTGDGKDYVKLESVVSGQVNLGSDNDKIEFATATAKDFTITSGAGKDTIDATGVTSGTVTLSDLDLNDVLVVDSAFDGANHLGTDGTVSVNGGATVVKVNGTNGYYAARINNGTTQLYGWGGEDSALLNASGATESVILYGNKNSDVVDTLVGGIKADTLVLGEGDYADGGKGNDSIRLNSTTVNSQEYVGLTTTGGKDTVDNFQKIDSTNDGDVVYLYQNNIGSGKLSADSSGNLVIKNGTASLTLTGVDASSEVAINVKDNTGKTQSVDYVATSASVSDTDAMQDIYYAGSKTAAIDFTNTDETLVVDLNNRNLNFNNTSLANSSSTTYYGKFASVTGGSDTTVLLGSATDKNTLVAGTGETSLWGGGAKADLLVGNSSTDNSVTYYYGNGDGKDTIQGANWGSDDNADVLYVGSASELVVKNDGVNTTVKVGDSDKLTVAGFAATDTAVKFTTDGTNVYEAKVGQSGQSNTWTYEEDVWAYIGGKSNSLTVGSNVDGAEIWLDGSKGKNFSSISTVDATSNNTSVGVAGTSGSEVLMGGTGSTSLWGGAGSDTLQGSGSGETTFFFGKGDGSDVISGSGSDDKVVLYNVALSDFAGVDTETSGQLKATLTDGSTLTIQNVSSSSVSTFTLSDGSTFVYDSSSKTFSQTK